jgi:Fic-DOC domain mobile mystery protein B
MDIADAQPVKRVLFGDLRPGETPIDDFTGLKVPDISTLNELAFHEASNISNVLVDFFRQEKRKPVNFDIEGVKALHGEMFCDVWEWAGQFRQRDINIPFSARFAQVQVSVYNLLQDLTEWEKNSSDPMEHSALLHHRAVQIHPFLNGNGRWSRLLTNAWLLEKAGVIIEWQSDMVQVSPLRNEYIQTLKAADEGDYGPLISLHRRFTPSIPGSVQPD